MADKRESRRGEDGGDDGAGSPPEAIGFPFRVLYRKQIDALHKAVLSENLEDRNNFVHALWMIVESGLSQKAFAEHRGFRASTVNRWVTGAKAPPPKRRPAIVRDALAMLEQAISNGEPEIMRTFGEEDEADVAGQSVGRAAIAPAPPASVARARTKTAKA
jgi:hypothetical protein